MTIHMLKEHVWANILGTIRAVRLYIEKAYVCYAKEKKCGVNNSITTFLFNTTKFLSLVISNQLSHFKSMVSDDQLERHTDYFQLKYFIM